MRRSIAALCLGLAGTVVLATSCSDDGGLGGPLILLTNSWREVGVDTHRFVLTDDTGFQPRPTGTFTGTEFVDADDSVGTPVDGDWSGGRVRMTVYSNPAVTWRAVVRSENPDTLVFTRNAGGAVHTLRIFRESFDE